MKKSSDLLKNSDFEGIRKLLSAFGGMGSFNDIFLSPEAEKLRSRIYDLAKLIEREV